jgi:hypothetical protein
MIGRHSLIEIELIKQLLLILAAPSHHRSPSPLAALERRNQYSPDGSSDFCNKIGQEQSSMATSRPAS